jgi:hypothetical protein
MTIVILSEIPMFIIGNNDFINDDCHFIIVPIKKRISPASDRSGIMIK